jgi:hypothetical protein
MHHYRQVLVRLRRGDTDREIARSRLMGRPKAAAFRALAAGQGWLDRATPLPDDATIAAAVGQARRARSTISTVEPYRALFERWHADGVSAVAIHAALGREHGYHGSYSSVHRTVAALVRRRPPAATVRLDFAPGEAAHPLHGPGAASRNVRQRYATPRHATTAAQREEVEVRDLGIYEHVVTTGAATALSEAA